MSQTQMTSPIAKDETIQQTNSLLTQIKNVLTAPIPDYISDAYDNTATYAVGDYCIHENTLYRCTTDISSPEEWTAAHWTATTMAAEDKEIKSSLSQFTTKFATVNNTFGNGNLDSKTDYPTGFTSNNCVIISIMYEYQNGRWDLIPNGVLANGVLPSLRTDKITVYNTVSDLYNKKYKVTLMRTDI